jgi:outer membrane protein OmpA-like peptidoglycan-associated protein
MRWLIAILLAAGLAAAGDAAHAQGGPTAVLCAGYQHQWDVVKGGSNTAAMRRVVAQISPACSALLNAARARLAVVERPRPPPRPAPAPPPYRPAAAPPPAAPAAGYIRDYAGPPTMTGVATKEFEVYFPFGSHVLLPEAQVVVQAAAAYAIAGHSAKVVVVGHTDDGEAVVADGQTSERRAKATADQLVGFGVAANSLDVSWKKNSDPAVQTAPGGREPLNRRVSIVVTY